MRRSASAGWLEARTSRKSRRAPDSCSGADPCREQRARNSLPLMRGVDGDVAQFCFIHHAMEHREARNLRRVRGFEFRHQNRPAGIASQMEVILLAPLRRLGTLQLDRINGRKIIAGAGSNLHALTSGAGQC